MLRSIVEDPGWARCTTVRQVFCSGEALPADLCARHYERHTAPLHNLYGPTEAAVDVSHWTVPADDTPRVVPIGRPIQNIQLHVLDEALAPQGIGCVGELYIAGVGLARGYLHQPELTRERFVPNPFDASPDARMYRTGDLVRRLPDGDLEFLGRADDQVKVRGFRIEPGEIEHRLTEHSAVRSAAVLVREDQPGSPRLVAYVVPEPGHALADHRADLVRHLEGALPEYMVPSAYVELAALPVTAHGKLDRRALPAPGIDAFAQRAYVAPVTGTERQLADVCAELLGFDADRVSAEDNFFALGGHSLMITVLVARLKESGLHVTVQDVFTAPTLAELAARIDATGATPAHTVPANRIPEGCERLTPDHLALIDLTQEQIDTVVAAVPGGAAAIQDIYPLLPTQEGIFFHHLMDPDNDPYLVSTLYRADDEQACTRFIDALQRIVDRHDVMRTAVLTAGLPEPVQVVHRAARLPVRRIRLTAGRDPEEQARELLARQERMRLDSAPLLRLVVAEEPHSQRRHLLLTAHHLIEDATSLRLILQELAVHMAGRADLLPTPAPYRDFVSHTLARHTVDDTVAHFRAVLEDVTEPTAPFGLIDVHGNGRRVGRLRRALPESLARDLRAQAQRLQLSPACLFHAAWACFVSATSGRDDVVFGAVMSGRLQGVPGVERMLGNFINTLPLRTRLAGRTVRELIADVDTGLRELIAREQSPLSLVQRCSGLDGDAPLFSAVVNFRHFEAEHDAALPRIDDHGVRFVAAVDAINYPVTVSLDDFGTELSLDVQVEETVTCEAVADCLETALAGLIAALAKDDGTGTAALDVNVLPAGDRRRLAEWNDTATPLPYETLPAAFEAQVARTPDRTALVFEGRTLSYAELNARANRLAHWLIERGAGVGQRVAIRMPRSFDLVVAVHAVVKTGAAYLPMETDLPDERVEQVLADSTPLRTPPAAGTRTPGPGWPGRTPRTCSTPRVPRAGRRAW
jgi:non-ribosomal peptide synthetase component F/aryl carrier-like protein